MIDAALNLLADIEAGKVRVVPVEPSASFLMNEYAGSHGASCISQLRRSYEAMLKAPPHAAETFLKGLK